jgi:hypothetical protein
MTIDVRQESRYGIWVSGSPEPARPEDEPIRGRIRGRGLQACYIAGFQIRRLAAWPQSADWEIGDTAGWETCATVVEVHAPAQAASGIGHLNSHPVVRENIALRSEAFRSGQKRPGLAVGFAYSRFSRLFSLGGGRGRQAKRRGANALPVRLRKAFFSRRDTHLFRHYSEKFAFIRLFVPPSSKALWRTRKPELRTGPKADGRCKIGVFMLSEE